MTFNKAMRAAADSASAAVQSVMDTYREGLVTDEDDLTGVLVGSLNTTFQKPIGGVNWSSSILRHRKGVASEEQKIGADLIIHVSVETKTQKYSKGVLIQSKRIEPGIEMSKNDHDNLVKQCKKMLDVSSASYVFDYTKNELKVGAANRIAGSTDRDLFSNCSWTSWRFFWELFRCPIGDSKITSARVDKLLTPHALLLKASSSSN